MEPTYWLAKGLLKPSLASWFRWHLEGLEHVPRSGAAIVTFNHIAYLDPLAAAYAIDAAKRRPRFLAKSELFEDKRIGWILAGAGHIPVRRGTREAPMALDQAFEALDRGEIVVVFPEGTITNDPQLNPMSAKSGTARLALRSRAPVLPAAIWGTQNVWPKGYAKHWWPPRQDLLVRIGPALRFDGSESRENFDAVGVEVMEHIARLVASLRPAVPDRRRRPKGRAA